MSAEHRPARGNRSGNAGRNTARGRRGPERRPGAARAQPARTIALEVIMAVRESDAYANLLLPVRLTRAALSPADAALATELTYGTLRLQGYYDAVIELAAGRDTAAIDAPILDVLRLACHQLLSMRVATHAAVDEAVSLARQVGSNSSTGFVNGVLRTISRTDPATWHERVVAGAEGEDRRLSAEHSHPVWIVRAFRRALAAEGRELELEELLRADNAAPRVTLAALPGLSSVDELPTSSRSRFSPVAAVGDGGDPARSEVVAAGRARVQDEGSQLAALALSRARPVERGERWLDLCAGPGGKAALLAAEASVAGAELLANEVVPARAELVRRALSALPEPPRVTELDGRELGDEHAARYDRVLVDAPCTGLGALRRRPEARWRKQPKDVGDLTRLQGQLLRAALRAVKPGGLVAYVTCSPHLAETVGVLDHVLADGAATVLDTAAVLAQITTEPLELGDAPGRGHVQLWPHRHGTDAMFICLLERTPAGTATPPPAG